MSDDEGEKFYLDYWTIAPAGKDGSPQYWESRERENKDEAGHLIMVNDTTIRKAIPPFLLHSTEESNIAGNILSTYIRLPRSPRSLLEKRAFQCPAGTSSCGSIDRSGSCCAEGQTCQLIQDTGLGDVGCCAAGEICAGSLSECESGYTSCPNYPGGGCCVPGYACVSGGCLLSSTATVIIIPSPSSASPTATQSSTMITNIISPSSSSTVIVSSPPVASASTPPPTSRSPSTTITSTSTGSNTLLCSSGFRSCPVSLGGGCCPTNRACGRDVCPELSSTLTVDAPVRPTSNDPTPTTDSNAPVTGCPTGFYACSAYYQGGCCRLGRDCAPTTCPGSATTTLIDDNSVTVIAPTSSGLGAYSILTGECATGWSSCAASDGGGCCPTGYVCGSSCTATATASGLQATEVGKLAPNAAVSESGRGVMVFGVSAALMAVVYLGS